MLPKQAKVEVNSKQEHFRRSFSLTKWESSYPKQIRTVALLRLGEDHSCEYELRDSFTRSELFDGKYHGKQI